MANITKKNWLCSDTIDDYMKLISDANPDITTLSVDFVTSIQNIYMTPLATPGNKCDNKLCITKVH